MLARAEAEGLEARMRCRADDDLAVAFGQATLLTSPSAGTDRARAAPDHGSPDLYTAVESE